MKSKQTRKARSANSRASRSQKNRYHVRNWKEYNTALVGRGRLTLWVEEATLAAWREPQRTGKRGRPRRYSDEAIACALTLAAVYHLPLRAVQGLVLSLLPLLGLADVPVPHYSTLCRRRARLQVTLGQERTDEPMHLAADSTGLKVFGEGEWKVRQHGANRRRHWRKVHLVVNTRTGRIRAAKATGNGTADGTVLPELLAQVEGDIAQVDADGSYDWRSCYEAIAQRGARAVVPPRKGARIWQHGNSKQERLARDQHLRRIRKVGRAQWKRESGYHQRSLVETAMFRLKRLFGDRLSARRGASQEREVLLRCAALNQMTGLGMPQSYAV